MLGNNNSTIRETTALECLVIVIYNRIFIGSVRRLCIRKGGVLEKVGYFQARGFSSTQLLVVVAAVYKVRHNVKLLKSCFRF